VACTTIVGVESWDLAHIFLGRGEDLHRYEYSRTTVVRLYEYSCTKSKESLRSW
jgi:hypothetical protein